VKTSTTVAVGAAAVLGLAGVVTVAATRPEEPKPLSVEQRLDRLECTVYLERCPSPAPSPGPSGPAGIPTTVPPPAPTPTPTPAATSARRWPDASTTGVVDEAALRPSGTITASKPGQLVENLAISGKLVITAPGVVVRNVRIVGGGPGSYPITVDTGGSVTVYDSEAGVAICCKRYELHRVEVRNAIDGLRADGSVLVDASWIHALARVTSSHNDAVQMLKGTDVRILRSRLEPRTGDDPMNAAFIISAGASGGPVDQVEIRGNWIDGGNYSLYLGAGGKVPGTHVTVADNVFTRAHRYGPVTAIADRAGFDRTTNRYTDGTPVLP
jgi:hypothetical protein